MLYKLLYEPPVLIYQMPKTGSQTIEATLQQCPSPLPVLRFHFLSPTIAATIRKGFAAGNTSAGWRHDACAQLRLMRQINWALRARKLLRGCGVRLPKLQIITGVREPISVALSSMFENYYVKFPEPGPALAACREALLNPKTLRYIQDWFDLELKRMLGFDVYQQPFDRAQGYGIYETRAARFLVFRFEALGRAQTMLQRFLNIKIGPVANRNVGAAKPYAEQYRYVQQHLKLPGDMVARQHASKLMQHFYSGPERAEFYLRWAEFASEAHPKIPVAA